MWCELPTWYEWSEPIARKSHVCVECSAPIVKDERYFYGIGRYEWGIGINKQHLLCCQACMLIRDKFNGGECIGFGELFETWNEMKYQCDTSKEKWRELRSLLAKIKWRERQHRRA